MENEQQPKKMYDVQESCANCGTAITRLPFQPDPNRSSSLKCIDCWKKNRENQTPRNNF